MLYHWPFEIGLCSAKEGGGTAVSAVWELVYLFTPCPLEPRSTPTHTGGTPVPLFKNPKASGFWYYSLVLSTKIHIVENRDQHPLARCSGLRSQVSSLRPITPWWG